MSRPAPPGRAGLPRRGRARRHPLHHAGRLRGVQGAQRHRAPARPQGDAARSGPGAGAWPSASASRRRATTTARFIAKGDGSLPAGARPREPEAREDRPRRGRLLQAPRRQAGRLAHRLRLGHGRGPRQARPSSAARGGLRATSVRRRRMVRAFAAEPVDADVLDASSTDALRAPSAGNSQGIELRGARGPEQTARYWDVTLPSERRARVRAGPACSPRRCSWSSLADRRRLRRPLRRARQGRDRAWASDAAAWPVPYWLVDGGMAVEHLLLGAVDAGLGALFFGLFDHESAVRAALGIPEDRDVIGTVALGHPRPSCPAVPPPVPAARGRGHPPRRLVTFGLGRWAFWCPILGP